MDLVLRGGYDDSPEETKIEEKSMGKTVFELIEEHGIKGLKISDMTWEKGEYVQYIDGVWKDEGGDKYTMEGSEDYSWELYVEPRTFWVNVYFYADKGFVYLTHSSKESADKNADKNRMACITFKEGEGL